MSEDSFGRKNLANKTSTKILKVQLLKSDNVSDIVGVPIKSAFVNTENSFQPTLETQTKSSRLKTALMLPALLPSPPNYFHSSELTKKPVILQNVSPLHAEMLSFMPSQPVILRLLVNERGTIDHVIIEKSQLSDAAGSLLIEAFSTIKFEAGQIENTPVKSQMTIEVMVGPNPMP